MLHLSHHAKTTPEKPAIIMAETGISVSYKSLDDYSNRVAQRLRRDGLQHRQSVALVMENNSHFLQIAAGAERAGLYYTPISSRLTAKEIAYIVDDCDAEVFVISATMAQVAVELLSLMPRVRHRYMIGGVIPGYQSWEEALAEVLAVPVPDEMVGRDMLYSSGTTGQPKGVRRPIAGDPLGTPTPLLEIIRKLYSYGPEMIYLSPAPLYHAAPLRYSMAVLAVGGTAVIMEKFDPEQALELIERYRVTHSQWVPTMFIRMLKLPEAIRAQHDISSMQVAIHAAAPCPIPVKEAMIKWWGPVICEYYAATEGNGFCAVSATEWLERKGSVGKAYIGKPHIVDESGEELPPGQVGVIYFSDGPEFAYYKDAAKTAASRDSHGWTTLGDIGYLDNDGYLYLTDRKAYMIISGGVNIYPQEAENVLSLHPKVADVAVFGVPNDEFGEEVKAVVQPADGAYAGPDLEAELIAYCRQHLAAIKCPRSVDFDPELPRHPTGKLYKRLIRDRYWAGRSSKIL